MACLSCSHKLVGKQNFMTHAKNRGQINMDERMKKKPMRPTSDDWINTVIQDTRSCHILCISTSEWELLVTTGAAYRGRLRQGRVRKEIAINSSSSDHLFWRIKSNDLMKSGQSCSCLSCAPLVNGSETERWGMHTSSTTYVESPVPLCSVFPSMITEDIFKQATRVRRSRKGVECNRKITVCKGWHL